MGEKGLLVPQTGLGPNTYHLLRGCSEVGISVPLPDILISPCPPLPTRLNEAILIWSLSESKEGIQNHPAPKYPRATFLHTQQIIGSRQQRLDVSFIASQYGYE